MNKCIAVLFQKNEKSCLRKTDRINFYECFIVYLVYSSKISYLSVIQ